MGEKDGNLFFFFFKDIYVYNNDNVAIIKYKLSIIIRNDKDVNG